MPGTMTEKENLLSLLSIEVLISHVHIDLNIECHLPCMVFRLLDYPAVSIPYFDQWQVGEFHSLKRNHPNISWRQLLSDQFYELRSANGQFSFKRGKSCLFKTYFKTLYTHLLNVPLFLLLIDQINDSDPNTSHFIGSCNIKLNELIEILNQSIIKNGHDIPLVEQQTFHCTLFNLMGTKIGTCDIAVRFCHYGTTILTHLPMLDDGLVTNTEKKIPTDIKEQVIESSILPSPPSVETIVKHIHFVNEKKDIGLQLSRSDLPLPSNNNKSAQTRWTSTKTRSSNDQQSKSRYLHTIEDPSFDDPTITLYRPPPLYFNSDSDFLQIMTPSTTKVIEKAKENRLSYLASIPIASFDNESNIEDDGTEKQRPKRKSTSNVCFNLPPTVISQVKLIPKQQVLTKDFLKNFPLLRSLVEEALVLQQQHQNDMPISTLVDERPRSTVQQKQKNLKQTSIRSKSATNGRSIRAKSVILPRNINNTRRLYPPPPKTNQMMVTKSDVRNLVDRLSKPKLNKRIGREITSTDQDISTQGANTASSHLPAKPISVSSKSTVQKPPPTYGTTRAHRLMAEFSRARRTAVEPQAASSPKSRILLEKESVSNTCIPSSSSPQILNTTTISNLSLLDKINVDTTIVEKPTLQRLLLEKTPDNTGRTMKSASTSQDVSLKLTKTTSSNSESPIAHQNQEDVERQDDLAFSITDITDYFTDGGESSTRPPT